MVHQTIRPYREGIWMNDVLGLMEPTSPTSLEYSLFTEKTGGTGRGGDRRGPRRTPKNARHAGAP